MAKRKEKKVKEFRKRHRLHSDSDEDTENVQMIETEKDKTQSDIFEGNPHSEESHHSSDLRERTQEKDTDREREKEEKKRKREKEEKESDDETSDKDTQDKESELNSVYRPKVRGKLKLKKAKPSLVCSNPSHIHIQSNENVKDSFLSLESKIIFEKYFLYVF